MAQLKYEPPRKAWLGVVAGMLLGTLGEGWEVLGSICYLPDAPRP